MFLKGIVLIVFIGPNLCGRHEADRLDDHQVCSEREVDVT